MLSRKRYSEHGFVEFCRPVPLQVCHLWMVVSNCIPGSPQMQVPSAIFAAACAPLCVRTASVSHPARPPFAIFDRGIHELVAHPHAQIFILIHDRAVGVAVVTSVVTLLDQRPRFLLFLLLRVDEFLDVRMPVLSVFIFAARRVLPPLFTTFAT